MRVTAEMYNAGEIVVSTTEISKSSYQILNFSRLPSAA